VYVDVLRGLPLIVTLFLAYFGLPAIGVHFAETPVAAGLLALTLHLGAYLSETFRAALLAVDSGQMDAARGMGMSPVAAYRCVVLPQALVIAIPTLGSWFISLLKETSLLSFISVTELMRAGVVIVNQTFKPFEGYLTVGAIYLIISLLSSWLVGKLEARLTRSMRPQSPSRPQRRSIPQPAPGE
jgi:ABC-type amino acid transport system permease subunit